MRFVPTMTTYTTVRFLPHLLSVLGILLPFEALDLRYLDANFMQINRKVTRTIFDLMWISTTDNDGTISEYCWKTKAVPNIFCLEVQQTTYLRQRYKMHRLILIIKPMQHLEKGIGTALGATPLHDNLLKLFMYLISLVTKIKIIVKKY